MSSIGDDMLDQNTATILSTLLGGALTIIGGFIANYYTNKSSDKQLKVKEERETLQKLYEINQKVYRNFSAETLWMKFKQSGKIDPLDIINDIYNNIDNIATLVDLYIQELIGESISYMSIIYKETSKLFNILDNIDNDRKNNNATYAEKNMDEIADRVEDARTNFASAIVKIAGERGYR